MQLIDKYNRLILHKIPAPIATELDEIKTATKNFTDEPVMAILQENFDALYKIIEAQHAEAIKPKQKLLIPEKQQLIQPANTKRIINRK